MFRSNFCPSSGAQDWGFLHIVPRCRAPNPCLPQQQDIIPHVVKNLSLALLKMGKGEGSFLHTVHIVPRCRAPNPCLPQQQDIIPHVVKKPQSCAPEDGQRFARNMLSWSLEINKTVIVASRWFLFYLTYTLSCLSCRPWAQLERVLTNKRGQCTNNITLRRVLAAIVAVEKQRVLHKLSVCICSLRHTAYNAHAPYCHLWSAPLYNICPHCLINGTILGKKSYGTQNVCFDFL